MNRRLFVLIHLYLSAFFTAAVVLMAVSGGFYLLDIKGNMAEAEVAAVPGGEVLSQDPSKAAVSAVLARAGIDGYRFDYVRGSDVRLYTRPTSRKHYRLDIDGDTIRVSERRPDWIASIIELHKGHGPVAFRSFQQFLAMGLFFMVISGAWLGLSATPLRKATATAVLGGVAVVAVLISI